MRTSRQVVMMAVLTVIACSCAGKTPAVKRGAFEGGKIEVSTVGKPETHKADVVIAILPFRNNSADRSLDATGGTLAELISARLAGRRGFKLVERQRIEDVMKEMKLGMLGAVDQATAVQVGRLVGANVMGFGSFQTLGQKVLVTLRLVKVETGEIVGGVNERGDDMAELDKMAESAAVKLAEALAR